MIAHWKWLKLACLWKGRGENGHAQGEKALNTLGMTIFTHFLLRFPNEDPFSLFFPLKDHLLDI